MTLGTFEINIKQEKLGIFLLETFLIADTFCSR